MLRLFNPFADDARVNLSAVSELGAESDDSFQAVSVPARSTRTFALQESLPGREALSIFVEHVEGSVIPVMVQSTGTDTAMWSGNATQRKFGSSRWRLRWGSSLSWS